MQITARGQMTCFMNPRRTKSSQKYDEKVILDMSLFHNRSLLSYVHCPKMVMKVVLLTHDIFDDMAKDKLLKKSMCLYSVVQSAKNPLRSCHPFSIDIHKSSLALSLLLLAPKNRQ